MFAKHNSEMSKQSPPLRKVLIRLGRKLKSGSHNPLPLLSEVNLKTEFSEDDAKDSLRRFITIFGLKVDLSFDLADRESDGSN